MRIDRPTNPQLTVPCLFVRWDIFAQSLAIPVVHAEQPETPLDLIYQAMGIFHTEEGREFGLRNGSLFDRVRGGRMPLEGIAPEVSAAVYEDGQGEE